MGFGPKIEMKNNFPKKEIFDFNVSKRLSGICCIFLTINLLSLVLVNLRQGKFFSFYFLCGFLKFLTGF